MKKVFIAFCISVLCVNASAQDVPQNVSYTKIYDFLDELASEQVIDINTAIKPYSRMLIAQKLQEADKRKSELNARQRKDLRFFIQSYALEMNNLPETLYDIYNDGTIEVSLLEPTIYYKDSSFHASLAPLLGMHVWNNGKNTILKRWIGAEIQATIGRHVAVWGSLRDNSFSGGTDKKNSSLLSEPLYLNDFPAAEYKESSVGNGDFSDSRGGINFSTSWGSLGLVKDNLVWGDNYHGANILSGHNPSFPAVYLRLKPVKWLELNYFHGWLVSNLPDSARVYVDNAGTVWQRQINKFMAANMLTLMPIRNLNLSFGNSIVYAENAVNPGYFIPIAFYKSIDHLFTKGTGTENQNSQVYINFSSRNIKHLHLFASIFADEISFDRFKSGNEETNPISYKFGANLSNFPLDNLILTAEYTRNNIGMYKHKIPEIDYTSNSYNLGHYLWDNSQEIYLAATYKPIRGLDITASFTDARKGNEFEYLTRSNLSAQLKTPFLKDVIWKSDIIGLKATYEVFANAYAMVEARYSSTKATLPDDSPIAGEVRPETVDGNEDMTSQFYLDRFSPRFLQGDKFALMVGFGFGF
ncbi:MAG: hypothetical protein LBB41_02055 [Prevotellaceae bacterium]|jgi:hypothetical protein|nr:hypothetical protein [Prevotellaceae bacterium]